MKRKRVRSEAVCLWLRPDELALIREQMKTAAKQAEADRGQSAPKKNAPDRGNR